MEAKLVRRGLETQNHGGGGAVSLLAVAAKIWRAELSLSGAVAQIQGVVPIFCLVDWRDVSPLRREHRERGMSRF